MKGQGKFVQARTRCILFDWGDTLMPAFPGSEGPMSDWPRMEPMPSAQETLALLRADWLIALATNAVDSTEDDIWRALARVGLDRLIDSVYCFREIGHKKPHRDFFDFILNDLALSSSSVVMVGDNYDVDVIGAIRSGIRAVWFNCQSEEERFGTMQRTIHDLSELPITLQSWELEAI